MKKFKTCKSREGRNILHNLYRKYLAVIDVPVTEQMVETRFGDTHVALYGNPAGKPVLMFYGKNAINPLVASPFIRGLDMSRLRLIVPDPPGCIGFSAETKSPLSDREHGEWAVQVMDALELPCVAVLGYSFGAMMALQLCMLSLLRVERLLLVTPSCILRTPAPKISKLMRPAGKDRQSLTDQTVRKMLAPVMPFPHDGLTEMARMIMLHAKTGKEGTKPVRRSKLKKLNAPVYVVAEESDYLFPGRKLVKRANKIFPHIGSVHLLSTGSHCGLFYEENAGDLKNCFDSLSAFLAG
ncbi:MAG: alpha/beta hydrolase [Tannerella sp.]|jgi:pimeloyl-ACP methyl ester carboxylesterase|nr:alpha/beta hydrolase [Tannerella sp.]